MESLTELKGIGKWTVEMFLIFTLGRMDIMPVDDFGVRAALMMADARKTSGSSGRSARAEVACSQAMR